jgi:hypothetical protein
MALAIAKAFHPTLWAPITHDQEMSHDYAYTHRARHQDLALREARIQAEALLRSPVPGLIAGEAHTAVLKALRAAAEPVPSAEAGDLARAALARIGNPTREGAAPTAESASPRPATGTILRRIPFLAAAAWVDAAPTLWIHDLSQADRQIATWRSTAIPESDVLDDDGREDPVAIAWATDNDGATVTIHGGDNPLVEVVAHDDGEAILLRRGRRTYHLVAEAPQPCPAA